MVYGDKGRAVAGPFSSKEDAVAGALRYEYFNGRWGESMRIKGGDAASEFFMGSPVGSTDGNGGTDG